MKTLKVRDFQRHFYAYARAKASFQVVNNDGELIGTWLHGLPITEGETGKVVGVAVPVKDNSTTPAPTSKAGKEFEPKKCWKCKKEPVAFEGETSDENGEWIKAQICERCMRLYRPPKFKRIA